MKNYIFKRNVFLDLLKSETRLKLLFCIFTLTTTLTFANKPTITQDNARTTITGVVSDENGPLLGVSVTVKGKSVGTLTDFEGNYSLDVENASNATLVFSYIGYKTKEVAIGGQKNINITLEGDISSLEEVVVTGYTSRKRGDVTGSISQLKSEEISNTSNSDVAKSLAGKVSGLVVADRGGYPGSSDGDDLTLLIRGQATTNNNSPLILIDGVTASISAFRQLSPQDVETMSVLKDGAAAIYGTRAANGVILVTTKRGRKGKPKFNLSSRYTISQFTKFPKLMTSEQYAIYENEIAANSGNPAVFTNEQIANYANGNDPINFPSTDWADITFADSAPEQRHSLSISGGGDHVNYFVSGDILTQEGIFKSGDLNYKQYQVRSNLDIKLHDKFKLGVDLTAMAGEGNEPGVPRGTIFKHIFTNLPTEVGVYPNGLPGFGGEGGRNPVILSSTAAGFTKRKTLNLRSRFTFDWNLDAVVKGLKAKGFYALTQNSFEQKEWDTPWTYYQLQGEEYIASQGNDIGTDKVLREAFDKETNEMVNATLHYQTSINENHNINAFIGYEHSRFNERDFFAQRQGFSLDITELNSGGSEDQRTGGESLEYGFLSYFGSLSYNYDSKYYLDFTLRRDGSSRFAEGYKYGTFPGVAASWAIGKESFMQDIEWIDALKIRGSWSRMGNDRIPHFRYIQNFEFGFPSRNQGGDWYRPNGYVVGTPGVQFGGFGSTGAANPDVTWETANMYNVGVNFSLFNKKLTGDVNYFFQSRADILQTDNSVPDITGLTIPSLPEDNIAEAENYGVEIELMWQDKIGEVNYNFGFNFTQAKSKIISVSEPAGIDPNLSRVGKPITSYVVYPTNGIIQNQDQLDNNPVRDGAAIGDPFYVDVNEDGVIDTGDRVRTDFSAIPEIQYGIFGGASYKNWNFNFLLQGQAAAKTLVFFDQSGAKPEFVYNNRWTPTNTGAAFPRAFAQGSNVSGQLSTGTGSDAQINNGWQGSDIYIKDASFVRLKEIEIGYTFNKDVLKFGQLKLFARGFNIATFFSDIYDLGLDPEAAGYNNFRNSTYPPLKSYSVGLNLNF
ncbi:SusC/RagA family TonB-linked outer membrane protein [Wenyingzhuangia sp. IMCC45574]